MLFGIISDTHITDRVKELPDIIYDKFKNVDKIIHCGDITINRREGSNDFNRWMRGAHYN